MPRRRPKAPPAPLPQRQGIAPIRLRLPADGAWATVREHLKERLPVGADVVDAMLDGGEFVTTEGPLAPDTPYAPGAYVWFHRPLAPEPPVPYPIEIVHRDERLVIADKPHFLATTPRGSHITETALARLRHDLGLPELSPAHRLDRLTAGLVMFTIRAQDRGKYQRLFLDRRIHKEYEAIAAHDRTLALPRTVRSRIEKDRGRIDAYELPGEPNAESRVELLDRGTRHGHELARYRLLPRTGRTHQLRVHMNALGVPILGDPVYPVVTDPAPDDFSRPLQLLARVLEFTDPFTGRARRFESRRTLAAWTAYDTWNERRTPHT